MIQYCVDAVQEHFTHTKTSPLQIKGCKTYPFVTAFKQGGLLIVPYLLLHGASVYTVLSKVLLRSVASFDKPGVLRTYKTQKRTEYIYEIKNSTLSTKVLNFNGLKVSLDYKLLFVYCMTFRSKIFLSDSYWYRLKHLGPCSVPTDVEQGVSFIVIYLLLHLG